MTDTASTHTASSSSVGLVIPVFNEAHTIGTCLEHALHQTHPFDEIIVVDNASTDATVTVIERYRAHDSRIRLVREPRRGVFHARTAGFDAATTDLIGRIDADTRLRPTWVEHAVALFATDATGRYAAVTGPCVFYDAPFQRRAERQQRTKFAEAFDAEPLNGNNSMLRRTAWQQCRSHVSGRADVHEDLELGTRMRVHGWTIRCSPDLIADVSPRRLALPPWKAIPYYRAVARSYAVGGDTTHAAKVRRNLPIVYALTALLWPLYGAWNPTTHRWNPTRLLTTHHRISPLNTPPPTNIRN